MSGVWHVAQPISLKIRCPSLASTVAARRRSRGGAWVDRMNSANSSTSTPSSSGSGTVSNSATESPFDVFSSGCSGLVMPISFT